MSKIISPLTNDAVQNVMVKVGLQTRSSVIDGTNFPCIVASQEGNEFITYIQQGELLGFQAIVKSPQPGFRDVASHWNNNRWFTKVLTHKDGYCLRSEVDIKYGVTLEHLEALIDTFTSSLNELFGWVRGPGPRGSLPRPAADSASR